jgi:hypothetical protein
VDLGLKYDLWTMIYLLRSLNRHLSAKNAPRPPGSENVPENHLVFQFLIKKARDSLVAMFSITPGTSAERILFVI